MGNAKKIKRSNVIEIGIPKSRIIPSVDSVYLKVIPVGSGTVSEEGLFVPTTSKSASNKDSSKAEYRRYFVALIGENGIANNPGIEIGDEVIIASDPEVGQFGGSTCIDFESRVSFEVIHYSQMHGYIPNQFKSENAKLKKDE